MRFNNIVFILQKGGALINIKIQFESQIIKKSLRARKLNKIARIGFGQVDSCIWKS